MAEKNIPKKPVQKTDGAAPEQPKPQEKKGGTIFTSAVPAVVE